ncbi:hypothetical protein DIPPA_07105 [Diplonema papillatum]|nr:hypothetical protein DIPPA_07105 [Diplonema papillatum]
MEHVEKWAEQGDDVSATYFELAIDFELFSGPTQTPLLQATNHLSKCWKHLSVGGPVRDK